MDLDGQTWLRASAAMRWGVGNDSLRDRLRYWRVSAAMLSGMGIPFACIEGCGRQDRKLWSAGSEVVVGGIGG
ncbi:MAG: hypothetical protein U0176_09890 [Bacteroidia bacterium]